MKNLLASPKKNEKHPCCLVSMRILLYIQVIECLLLCLKFKKIDDSVDGVVGTKYKKLTRNPSKNMKYHYNIIIISIHQRLITKL